MKKNKKNVKVVIKINRKRLSVKDSYEKIFLMKKGTEKRGDKCISLSPENHKRLSRIAHIIGEDRLPLYAYLDNILSHHFCLFETMLIAEFEAKCKPLL